MVGLPLPLVDTTDLTIDPPWHILSIAPILGISLAYPWHILGISLASLPSQVELLGTPTNLTQLVEPRRVLMGSLVRVRQVRAKAMPCFEQPEGAACRPIDELMATSAALVKFDQRSDECAGS